MKRRDSQSHRPSHGSKGDMNRVKNRDKYRLGFRLMEIKEKFGEDSDEYREAVKEWREA